MARLILLVTLTSCLFGMTLSYVLRSTKSSLKTSLTPPDFPSSALWTGNFTVDFIYSKYVMDLALQKDRINQSVHAYAMKELHKLYNDAKAMETDMFALTWAIARGGADGNPPNGTDKPLPLPQVCQTMVNDTAFPTPWHGNITADWIYTTCGLQLAYQVGRFNASQQAYLNGLVNGQYHNATQAEGQMAEFIFIITHPIPSIEEADTKPALDLGTLVDVLQVLKAKLESNQKLQDSYKSTLNDYRTMIKPLKSAKRDVLPELTASFKQHADYRPRFY